MPSNPIRPIPRRNRRDLPSSAGSHPRLGKDLDSEIRRGTRIAGIAAHGSSATRPCKGLRFLLDEAFRIPGTGIRFGLDGIIGLVPGVGDVLPGLLSLIIPLAAWIRGVPYVTLARMAANLGIGVLVGSIPLFGDIFDIFWKANRRNYLLLRRHLDEPRRHTGATGRFCSCWPRPWRWSSPFPWLCCRVAARLADSSSIARAAHLHRIRFAIQSKADVGA
jgi:hypothetical protein